MTVSNSDGFGGWGPQSPGSPGAAAFSVTGPAEVVVNSQRQGVTAFTVTNLTGRPVRARLIPRALQGADQSWLSLVGPPELPMAVGATLTVTLNVLIPPTAPGGAYLLRLDVVPEDDTEAEVEGQTVSFTVPTPVTPKKRPRWLLPAIIGALVLVLAVGTGIYLLTRNPGGGAAAGKWTAWQTLPGNKITSSPAASSWGPGRLDVFARGSDGLMWHRSGDGKTFSDWDSRGGPISGAPTAVSWGPNRIDAFCRGLDGQLWTQVYNSGAWTTWIPLGGGYLTSSPAVASWATGRLDVFAKGPDNTLWHRIWNGSWGAYESLGGELAGAPAAVSFSANHIDVFYRGNDNHLYQKSWDGAAWSAPKDLGGTITSDPTVSSSGPNKLDVFASGTDNAMQHRSWNGTAWSGWDKLGGPINGAPAAIASGSSRIDAFATDFDGNLLHKSVG
jgi:hypothetical protein